MTKDPKATDAVAIRKTNDATCWYLNERLHRLDGPAVEYNDGGAEWYQFGRLHRIGGPAMDYASGYKAWWQNGVHHRLDGPAVEFSDGRLYWFINGKNITYEINSWIREQKITLPMSETELSFFILTFVGN